MKYFLFGCIFFLGFSVLAAEPTEVHQLARADGTQITYYVTRPTGVQSYPFLIVMQGSECTTGYIQAKDSSFVDALGVASVVVEKYGVTKDTTTCPQSYLDNNTIDQRIQDYSLVVDYLRKNETSWNKNIVLAGGSEGGEVASLIAPLIPEAARLIVMSAGGGMAMADELLLLLSKQMTAQGATKEQIQKAQDSYRVKYDEIKSNPTTKLSWFGDTNTYKWWNSILWKLPVNQLLRVNVPILMVHGDADQAAAVEGSRLVQDAFKKVGKNNLTYIEYPGLDHHWVDAKGNSHGQEVMADIGKWITSQTGFQKVDADLKAYDDTVIKMKEDFDQIPANATDIKWVTAKLDVMVKIDQFMRGQSDLPFQHKYNDAETKYFWQQFYPRFSQVDSANTRDLKELLKIYPWFIISKFGVKGDNQGWLLVQHADLDVPFQKVVLNILKDLYPIGETSKSNFAYLWDRVTAIGEKKPQRYGTQGHCTGPATWEPHPIEDPDHVDQRRAEMGLETMAEYKKHFVDICH